MTNNNEHAQPNTPDFPITTPTVSHIKNDVLNYDELTINPVINILPWPGINSGSRVWLHCLCELADEHVDFFELTEAQLVSLSAASAFSCELPLEKISTLKHNTVITLVVIATNDQTLEDDSFATSRYAFTLHKKSSQPVNKPAVNYSRWMTDIGSDIRQLKVHDLIVPEAHNAGVDKKGASWPTDQWWACQDDTFSYQLKNGIRALDLRLYNRGNSLIFKHSGRDANRYLSGCLHSVSIFARNNPGELVILDFHEVFTDGREAEVAKMIETSTGGRCIPATASNMTIGQIRDRFPNKNIIIAWNHSAWFCWRKVHQTWTGNNFNSEYVINTHISSIMRNPPANQLWSIFAAGYNELGPVRFKPHALFWNTFFDKAASTTYRQPVKGNMINVDFFAGTGVVDRCIAATRDRARKAQLASPVRLTAHNITINSVELRWAAPADNESVVSYTLYANDKRIASHRGTAFVFTGLAEAARYHLRVVPLFVSGEGAASEITVATKDETKPGKPNGLNFLIIDGHPKAFLYWSSSTDNVAVSRYEIYGDEQLLGTNHAGSKIFAVERSHLIAYRVRAIDAAGNFADSDSINLPEDRMTEQNRPAT